jgi:hypothetical protein
MKQKMTWEGSHFHRYWKYQDEAGQVFGIVGCSGGAGFHPYRPITFHWVVGTDFYSKTEPGGEVAKLSEAKKILEKLYKEAARKTL